MTSEEGEAGLVGTLGMVVTRATGDEAIVELEVRACHRQGTDAAFGVVHGGVYCALIETATSLGAYEVAKSRGEGPPLGVEHSASFLRSAAAGRLVAKAKPLSRGRTTQVWEATVFDAEGKVLATGRVRFLPGRAPAP